MSAEAPDVSQATPAATGRPDQPRGGFGVALSLVGRVHGVPRFVAADGDRPACATCFLECGATFPVESIDGEPRTATVYPLELPGADGVAFLHDGAQKRTAGWLDRAAGAFYTEARVRQGGFLPDGRSAADAPYRALSQARALYDFNTLALPAHLYLVGYGALARQFAALARDGSVVAVEAYGRTRRRHGVPRRLEGVMTYVQFLHDIAWPDGGPDRFVPDRRVRLGPTATVVGVVAAPPQLTEPQNGHAAWLNLVVSAGYREDASALVTLVAAGRAAAALAARVRRGDLVQARCALLVQRSRGRYTVRFAVRELAVLGHRAEG